MMSDYRKTYEKPRRRVSSYIDDATNNLKNARTLGYKEALDDAYRDLHSSKFFSQLPIGHARNDRIYPVPLMVYGAVKSAGRPGVKPIEFPLRHNLNQKLPDEFLKEVIDYELEEDKDLEKYIHSSLGQTALRSLPLERGLFGAVELRTAETNRKMEASLFVPKIVIFNIKNILHSKERLAEISNKPFMNERSANLSLQESKIVAKKLALSGLYNAFRRKLV